jgi:hypothetical protein
LGTPPDSPDAAQVKSEDEARKDRIKAAVENSVSRKRKIGTKKIAAPELASQVVSPFAIIKANEPNLFAPLTDEVEEATVHYLENAPGEGGMYVHCNGDDCVLCEARKSPTVLLMMAFYDLRRKELAVIKGGASESATSLFNQIEQVMLSDPEFPFCLEIEKKDRFSFKVRVKKLDPKHIEREQYQLAKVTVDAENYSMQGLIARKTNDEILEEYPSIRSDLNLLRDLE